MKKVNSSNLFVAILISFFAASCAPAYIPNTVNAPLLSNKGEVQASIYAGLSGYDPQVAYAVTDHIGVMFNGSFANQSSDTTDNYHRHVFGEFGAGYYTKFGDKWRFEVYGGAGLGKIQANYENGLWLSRSDVNNFRAFLQPGIGFTTEVGGFSFNPRLVGVSLYQNGGTRTVGYFMEPTVTGKVGYKFIKAVGQIGFSVPVGEELLFEYNPFIFSVGLQFNIGNLWE